MPLFAPVMMIRLPASEGMSAAFHFSLISVLDVAAWRLRCELFPLCWCASGFTSGLAEKLLDYLRVLDRLFVGGQMAALFEDNELCSGNCLVDVPGVNRRDIHVTLSEVGCFLWRFDLRREPATLNLVLITPIQL